MGWVGDFEQCVVQDKAPCANATKKMTAKANPGGHPKDVPLNQFLIITSTEVPTAAIAATRRKMRGPMVVCG